MIVPMKIGTIILKVGSFMIMIETTLQFDHSIVAGLGRVCFSAPGLMIDVPLQMMT